MSVISVDVAFDSFGSFTDAYYNEPAMKLTLCLTSQDHNYNIAFDSRAVINDADESGADFTRPGLITKTDQILWLRNGRRRFG